MNVVVDASYAEGLHRLAVGFEPVDPVRGGRLAHPVRIEPEGVLPWSPRHPDEPYGPGVARRRWRRARAERDRVYPRDPLPRIDRHDSCRQVLLVQPGLGADLDLRIYDHRRRHVPRRFQLGLADLPRVRRPALYPGAAYDLCPRTTGLRGRVTRDDVPMRWTRVEARLPGPETVVGRAHGDDRGEFLLVLAPAAAPPEFELDEPEEPYSLEVRVMVFGPPAPPVPPAPDLPAQDPWWDLPQEDLDDPAVASGETLPGGYVTTLTSTRIVPFRLGRMISRADAVADFEF